MACDILMAAQGGSCAIIHTECCVYIHDYSQNVSDFLQDMKSQVQEMADFAPPFGTVLWSWVSAPILWKPLVLIGSLILLLLLFGPYILNWLSCFVMSHIEAIKLQMVMEMEPKMIYQDPLDRPTGGEPNCHPLTMSLHSSKKPDQSLPLSP